MQTHRTAQRASVHLGRSVPPTQTERHLSQRQADAMLAVAAAMRQQAESLPGDDEIGVEFREWARDYTAAAGLRWPPYGGVPMPRKGERR